MVKQGHHETARALYDSTIKQANGLDKEGLSFNEISGSEGIENRKQILNLIRDGKIMTSLKLINQLYPSFQALYPQVYVQMMCLRFVEIIRTVSPRPSSDAMDIDQSTADMEVESGSSILDAISFAQNLKDSIPDPSQLLNAINVRFISYYRKLYHWFATEIRMNLLSLSLWIYHIVKELLI